MMTGRDPTGDTFRASGGDEADDVEVKPHGGALRARRPRETTTDPDGVVAKSERLVRVYAGAGQVVFGGTAPARHKCLNPSRTTD
jgi:hypothetical protein